MLCERVAQGIRDRPTVLGAHDGHELGLLRDESVLVVVALTHVRELMNHRAEQRQRLDRKLFAARVVRPRIPERVHRHELERDGGAHAAVLHVGRDAQRPALIVVDDSLVAVGSQRFPDALHRLRYVVHHPVHPARTELLAQDFDEGSTNTLCRHAVLVHIWSELIAGGGVHLDVVMDDRRVGREVGLR